MVSSQMDQTAVRFDPFGLKPLVGAIMILLGMFKECSRNDQEMGTIQ